VKRKHFITSLLSFVSMGSVIFRDRRAEAKPRLIVLGQVGLSFYRVKAALVQLVLEELGYTVEIVEGPHEKIFPLLGQGKVDLFVAAWLPEAHATYWNQVKAHAVPLTTLYDKAYFFWGVPDYVPQSQVQSIADLTKPEVMAKMNKTIQGIGQGATITVFSQNAMKAYGLQQAGYEFRTGTAKEWVSVFEQAIAQKQWVLLPTWQPQYLNQAHKIRPLLDPKGVLGGINKAELIATQAFLQQFPAQTVNVLRRIQLDIATVTQLDYQVNVEQKTPRATAQAWIAEHSDQFKAWLAEANPTLQRGGSYNV
jgi:glycine betaine/proline transport system substrate-binding protein